jgi:hypothetical protein
MERKCSNIAESAQNEAQMEKYAKYTQENPEI